ncbi:hypothetical protein L218DRAFT_617167 [Marasmius fiardii PR-910]|nr:hypothetical protein L218DRAFT_617167 [Marasmius fiardii PR-910]
MELCSVVLYLQKHTLTFTTRKNRRGPALSGSTRLTANFIMTSSTLATIANYFHPTRGEALLRIRANSLCLLGVCIVTYLLPLPSIPSSILVVTSKGYDDGEGSFGWWWWGISLFEVIITVLCSYNIVEGLYAIKYPRTPLPPPHLSPLKKKQGLVMSPSPARPSSILSPNATPSKMFNSSTNTQSLSFSTGSFRGSTTPGKYATSPFSTPSRVVRYNMPPQPGSTASVATTNASSTSTMPPTPSPVVSAYRGKQSSMGSTGRPIDGLYVSQILTHEEEED